MEAEDLENPLAMLAAKFVELAATSRLPVLSYFCEIPRAKPDGISRTREERGAVSLVYALLRQLVELLLPRFHSSIDLSEERFLRLDGTLDSWEEAMLLLRDLVGLLIQNTVFCVIDGMHWLDDKSTDNPLRVLVESLRASNKVRLLFTTSGRSACLRGALRDVEVLVMDSFRPKADGFIVDHLLL